MLAFLRWFCDPELLEDVEGDLTELYRSRATRHPIKAKLFFFTDVISSLDLVLLKTSEYVVP